mmetsp:Transcript_34087/g.54552  ORF Transcript_34087/g.54552 Transcript_34087/m.54552 type:complete len:97 (-) Transcript_34087:956-1246(-)
MNEEGSSGLLGSWPSEMKEAGSPGLAGSSVTSVAGGSTNVVFVSSLPSLTREERDICLIVVLERGTLRIQCLALWDLFTLFLPKEDDMDFILSKSK